MKKVLPAAVCALALLAGSSSNAAEKIQLEKTVGCYLTEKGGASSAVIGADRQSAEFKGQVTYSGRFGYLIARISCAPFKLAGNSLKFVVSANYHPADAFYIKALNKAGKIVASFVTHANLSDPGTMICTPGKSGARVKFIQNDVKGDPDSEITSLTFFFCRKGPGPDFQANIRGIELIPEAGSSSVTPEPQTAPGPLKFCRITGSSIPKTRPKAVLNADQGEIELNAEVRYEKYQYLISSVEVRPFLLTGKSIELEVKTDNHAENDSFYLKCYDAENRIVASFCTRQNLTRGEKIVFTPGGSGGKVLYLEKDVKAPETSPVVRLVFFCGRRGPGQPVGVKIKNPALVKRPPQPVTTGFKRYGVGIASAEVRNLIAWTDKNGRKMILCNPGDEGDAYLLVTDLATGKTDQHYMGRNTHGDIFGGVLTDGGKFVYGIGGKIHIFDLYTRKVTVSGKCPRSSLCATTAPDGKVYLGGYPESQFAVVDPETGKSSELGRMDPEEHYCSWLAADKLGFVYAGIGTARANLIAYDPKTGKRTQLLPEKLRKLGTAQVVSGDDGCVYAMFYSFSVKCLGGKIIETGVRFPRTGPVKSVKYQNSLPAFDDGSSVARYDMDKREIELREADGKTRIIRFDYVSGGLNLTSLAAGPDGKIYFSSSHPHHLGCLDPDSGKITDLGFNPRVGGGNFCNMAAFNGKLYAGEYAGGRMWEYDPAKPVSYVDPRPKNFGVPFSELLKNDFTRNGLWRALQIGRVLFASSGDDDNEFRTNLKVPGAGRWFLNLQFLELNSYGTVTIKAGGREFRHNTQQTIRQAGRMLNLGPFELNAGDFPVSFSVRANQNKNSKNMFAIIGMELSKQARLLSGEKKSAANPEILAAWSNLIARPRAIAVHPSSGEVVIAGFANYGMVGGGFGIWNSQTGKTRQISDWLPGESCYDMYFQADGDLVGGTSIDAPGGGHQKASAASVFTLDWKSGKVVRCVKLQNVRHVFGVREFGPWIFAAASQGTLYRINRKNWTVEDQFDLPSPVNRNPLLKTADGKRLFLLTGRTIYEIDAEKGEPEAVARTPWHLSAGGAILGNRIYFIQRENIASWNFGGVQK